MTVLPFDSHNHVHMGPTDPLRALLGPSSATMNDPVAVSGMAIMSTHPRDYARVQKLAQDLPQQRPGVHVVPCFGVHPWWLHELSDQDWEQSNASTLPRWINDLGDLLLSNPDSIVGETGLDGFHFDPVTKELVSPMSKQLEAFRLQMELAARLRRPVSIHSVQCFGSLFETLSLLKKSRVGLPPKIYFHAFGGKVGTVDQVLAICGRDPGLCYFGFAPVVNFRSPKTADVIRKVGIDRLVLETDHEDAAFVPESLMDGIRLLANSLNMEEGQVVEQTTANAFDFYGLDKACTQLQCI
jgi:Tat protein secretion system quality control protein TatD with DNase activity